jgi:signal transduction histidine kinase
MLESAKEEIVHIKTDLQNSKNTFDQLTQNIDKTQITDLEKRLAGRLQINSQLIVNSATKLSNHALIEREQIRQQAASLFLFLIFAISLVVIVVFLLLYRSIARPVNSLSAVAKQVHTGNLLKRAKVFSKDELGELAIAFNDMLDALKASHENLENKIYERTKQLEQTNKDLEAFTYSASHDLRAPLRAIEGFSKILADDYSEKLGDEGKSVVKTIRESSDRMTLLLEDLLAFSRSSRKVPKTEAVNMTELVKSVFEEIKTANLNRSIEFSCTKLPVAQVDPILIRQVWTNLLSNAVKYTKKKEKTIINVGSEEKENQILYFVKDNGAGFDMKYKENLFGVFQRLHSSEEFEGTGVGLAIVARIIKKHGGRVWAEGVVDQGATFYFSLPKA